jgi:hypothetical protein
VRFADVFPHGAYALSVDPLNDYEQAKAGFADPQERDKESGERTGTRRIAKRCVCGNGGWSGCWIGPVGAGGRGEGEDPGSGAGRRGGAGGAVSA